ncbi:hypothetical protein HLB44_14240 [Aquincola sp. S2]|uniref:Cytochrome c domain-containing protein n=1 Tax=Pseudaquabacterium terrae TaxID=2732868 RepID=A0ABX2EHP4_9BURK|nr:hypothetical protein [Aquabacterium terrae]NRF68149.1 hypothetical protein [Aquabacterium terrae]
MTPSKRPLRRGAAALLLAASALSPAIAPANPAAAAPDEAMTQRVRQIAQRLADEFAARCPLAEPGDEAALNGCRQALFGDSALREQLTGASPEARVLWGRQRDPKIRLADASLTQFAPDALTGMYLPLFMFNGEHSVEWVADEKMYRIRLRTAFRNRLQPGLFPYPFWHEAEKWSMYQAANEVLLWWQPLKSRITAAQFTVHGSQPALARHAPVPAPTNFDGRWMWADAAGRTQPKMTLFDGLFAADNPHLANLDDAYRKLALRLREGQCDSCHVPNNPHKSKRLVLLQTPAHAAAEISRVLKSLRIDRMPLDETGIEAPLDKHVKQALLDDGAAFATLVEAARQWEAQTRNAAAKPATPGGH